MKVDRAGMTVGSHSPLEHAAVSNCYGLANLGYPNGSERWKGNVPSFLLFYPTCPGHQMSLSLVARCQLGQEQITYTLKQACRLPVLSVDERRLLSVLLNVTS